MVVAVTTVARTTPGVLPLPQCDTGLREKSAGYRSNVPSLPTIKKNLLRYSDQSAEVSLPIKASVEQAGTIRVSKTNYSGMKSNGTQPAALVAAIGWFGLQRVGLP